MKIDNIDKCIFCGKETDALIYNFPICYVGNPASPTSKVCRFTTDVKLREALVELYPELIDKWPKVRLN